MNLLKHLLEITSAPLDQRFDADEDYPDPQDFPHDEHDDDNIDQMQHQQVQQDQPTSNIGHAITKLEAAVKMLQAAGDNVIRANIESAIKDLQMGESVKPKLKPRAKQVNDVLMGRKGGAHYNPKKDFVRAKEMSRVRKDLQRGE